MLQFLLSLLGGSGLGGALAIVGNWLDRKAFAAVREKELELEEKKMMLIEKAMLIGRKFPSIPDWPDATATHPVNKKKDTLIDGSFGGWEFKFNRLKDKYNSAFNSGEFTRQFVLIFFVVAIGINNLIWTIFPNEKIITKDYGEGKDISFTFLIMSLDIPLKEGLIEVSTGSLNFALVPIMSAMIMYTYMRRKMR